MKSRFAVLMSVPESPLGAPPQEAGWARPNALSHPLPGGRYLATVPTQLHTNTQSPRYKHSVSQVQTLSLPGANTQSPRYKPSCLPLMLVQNTVFSLQSVAISQGFIILLLLFYIIAYFVINLFCNLNLFPHLVSLPNLMPPALSS